MSSFSSLSEAQISFFHDNGYLHVPGFWTKAICEDLRSEAQKHVREFFQRSSPSPDAEKGKSVFTTNDQVRQSDEYFLTSGDKVCCFYEEKALNENHELIVSPENAINKIGHGLHLCNPVFKKHSATDQVKSILHSLQYEFPSIAQSMYIFKQPEIGGEVSAHQDGTFLYTEPQSVLGFWWALEDCDLQNGCLWGVPKSHTSPLARRFVRNSDNVSTRMEELDNKAYDISKAVPIPTKQGDLVLLHSAFVHFSKENTSQISRHAYSIHIIECGKNTVYPENNWLQLSDGKCFQPLYSPNIPSK